ncbi:hypothetical protein PoB_007136500 [Plakobranchus ocellatus]|uniref:T-box domain-containing protein n=1 Tax=Plakobranchus ocellatus TaxID=259542 RepID=A0AAV4DL34_9GAST|nr:hypothetical protein PoB_007136500 [Plakobranchus ocellatus]
MNNNLFTETGISGREQSNEGRSQDGNSDSSLSSPRHLLGISGCPKGHLEEDQQSFHAQQFMQQQQQHQDSCGTPTGSVYHELQPYTPTSQQMFQLPASSSSSGFPQQFSDSCCYSNSGQTLPASYYNHPHQKQQQQQQQQHEQQRRLFNSGQAAYFASEAETSPGYYTHHQQQQLEGEQQRMLPYFPALASSMNPWPDQHQQQLSDPGYPQTPMSQHHQHLHHLQHHPHHVDMEAPVMGDHNSPSSFSIGDPTSQSVGHSKIARSSSGSGGAISSNMLPPVAYPLQHYQGGIMVTRSGRPASGSGAVDPEILPYHRGHHGYTGFSHQGRHHSYSRSHVTSQWTATGKGKVAVTLYNGDMWAKFHEHTNEMIITKHGR